ncbi:hypothetical protein GCM10009429_05040 [Dyella marensis]
MRGVPRGSPWKDSEEGNIPARVIARGAGGGSIPQPYIVGVMRIVAIFFGPAFGIARFVMMSSCSRGMWPARYASDPKKEKGRGDGLAYT